MLKKCEICGKTFESFKRSKYCSDTCRATAIRINKLRYQAKNINRIPTSKTLDDFNHEIDMMKQATKKQFEVVPQTNNIDYITKSIEALKQLDEARKNVQDIIDVLKIEQARYYKEDNDFNHLVEGSGNLTDMQRLQAWDEYAKTRSKRRNVKDIIKTLIGCIRYTPYNSEKIIKDALQNKIKVDEFFKDFYKQKLD